MDKSNTMTIDFLRARLLSERSVSRSAKLRAEQLADRVMELEEQLRIVTIQRKKAEEAAAEVLAILECQGISDSSEVIDSSSDHSEVRNGRGKRDDTVKGDHISTHTRTDSCELEDRLSGSETDTFHSHGNRLSWKSRTSNASFHVEERQRQRHSFRSLAESSPKHYLAKSCRKIRQKDSGLTAKDDPRKTVIQDTHAIGRGTSGSLAVHTDILSDTLTKETEDVDHNISIPRALYDSKKQINLICSNNGCDKVETMERALEKQAQLIDQFQVEENAQRDWEEKYSENQSSNLRLTTNDGTCAKEHPFDDEKIPSPGYLSNSKEPIIPSNTVSTDSNQKFHDTNGDKYSRTMEEPNLSSGNASRDPIGTRCPLCFDGFLTHQSDESTLAGNGSFREDTQAAADVKANQGHPFVSIKAPNNNVNLHSTGIPIPGNTNEMLSEWRSTDTQNRNSRQVLQHPSKQHPSKNSGSVLQALQRAKLSLSEELSRPPSSQRSPTAAPHVDTQIQPIDDDKMFSIPASSIGLFRVPTDSFLQDNRTCFKSNTHALRLATVHPDHEYAPAEPLLPANSNLDTSRLRLAAIRADLEYPLLESIPGSSLSSGLRIDASVSRISAITHPDLTYLHSESFIRSTPSELRLAAIRPDNI